MTTLWVALAGVVAFIGSLFMAVRYGRTKEARRQAETNMEAHAHDADISTRPYVAAPFGRMRAKKK